MLRIALFVGVPLVFLSSCGLVLYYVVMHIIPS